MVILDINEKVKETLVDIIVLNEATIRDAMDEISVVLEKGTLPQEIAETINKLLKDLDENLVALSDKIFNNEQLSADVMEYLLTDEIITENELMNKICIYVYKETQNVLSFYTDKIKQLNTDGKLQDIYDILYQFPHPMEITFLMLKEAKYPEEYETIESMLENIISAEMEI